MPEEISKIPPQNLEAEQSLLGSLLIDKNAFIKIADVIDAGDFYKDSHRIIFEQMLKLYSKQEPIDFLTLTNLLTEQKLLEKIGGRTYLTQLSNIVPTSSHAVHYANIVRKKATRRRLLNAATGIVELGYEENEDVDKLLDLAEQKLFSVSQKHLKHSFIPINNVLNEAFDRIDELHKDSGKLRGLPTGFQGLDNLLAGLQKSDLVVLAARPSVGKTSLALDIARQSAIRTKTPVGIFSLEMAKEQLVDRLLCAEANVDLWKMRTGKLSDRDEDDDFPRIGHAMGILSEAPIFIDDSAMLNIIDIRTKARRLQAEHGLGLIIIDYLQLMESRANAESRVQAVAEITRALKGIARELDVPVLALSQLSRAVEMSKPAIPKLAHLRESGCLSGDSLILDVISGKWISIEKLVQEDKKIKTLTINKKLKNENKTVKKLFNNGKKQLYEITTRTGRTIKATANHKFLNLNGWHALSSLKIGQRIAVPRKLSEPIKPQKIEKHKIIILAHLIGDGCYLKRQPLHYTNNDPLCIKTVEQAGKQFGLKPKLIKQKTWYHVYLTGENYSGKKNPIIEYLKKLDIYNQRSKEKIIPDLVFSLSNKQLALFIKHLWATDGCISFNKSSNNWIIFYASNNKKLIQQLQTLLLRFGIISTIRINKKKGYSPTYQLHIQGAEEQLKFLKQISIFGRKEKAVKKAMAYLSKIKPNTNLDVIPKEIWQYIAKTKNKYNLSWREFAKKLKMSYCGSTLFKHGISRQRLERIIKFLPDSKLKELANSDIYWDEIISIKRLGKENVYDLNIPVNHNFTANAIFAHNSIEQDADVVMFIYRKTADRNYTPEQIPPEDKNIAEIHIAKHRNGPTGLVKLFFDETKASFLNLEKQERNL